MPSARREEEGSHGIRRRPRPERWLSTSPGRPGAFPHDTWFIQKRRPRGENRRLIPHFLRSRPGCPSDRHQGVDVSPPDCPEGATRAGLPLGFRSPQASGSRRCGVPPPRHPGGEGCSPSLLQGEPAPRIPESGPDRHGSLGRAAPQGRGLDSLGGVGPLEGQRPRPLEAAPRVRPALMLHLVGEEPWRGEVCVWGAPGALRWRACRPP